MSPDNLPRTFEELLGPALMGALDRLDVHSRRVFAGRMPGERRSKSRGQSVEFDDYREYTPGDDLRHLDWNVFARFDRFVVKLFREDRDLSVRVVLDATGSMLAGEPCNLVTAARLAAAVGYVGLMKQNRVSVSVLTHDGVVGLAPMRGRRSVQRMGAFLLEVLDDAARGAGMNGGAHAGVGGEGFNGALTRIASDRLAGQGVVFLISDLMVREGWTRGLDALSAARGFDAAVLQVLSPDELDPMLAIERGFAGDLRLTDVESGRGAEVTVSAQMVKRYRERLGQFIGQLERDCHARGMLHRVVASDADVGGLITGELRRRGLFV
ncbi:MAG: DUF58 domain-containing protein [Phycisphaerales bacterium JB040]